MYVVLVNVIVKAEAIDDFRQATCENAEASLQEPGIVRFDVLQQQEQPTRFVLVEGYRTSEAALLHKETRHYQKWRDRVAEMMAEPRTSTKFNSCYPPDSEWK